MASDDGYGAGALGEYAEEVRFGERLAALAAYRELRERRYRNTLRPGDKARLRAAIEALERTGGLPADWLDPR